MAVPFVIVILLPLGSVTVPTPVPKSGAYMVPLGAVALAVTVV